MENIWNTYEDLPDTIYAADMDTYELIYMNSKARERYGIVSLEQIKGKKCYELLQNCSEPCAMCTNDKIANGAIYEWEYYNQLLKEWFRLKDQMVNYHERRVRIEIATSVAHTDASYRYAGVDKGAILLNECLRMALEESDSDKGLQKLLEYLGITMRGGRAYIFELNENNCWDNTYEWCAFNVTPQMEFLRNIPITDTAVWNKAFTKNEFIIIRDIEEIKDSNPEIYEYLKPQDIQSIIVGPLYLNGKLTGFYGIDNPPLKELEIVTSMLKTIGHVIDTMIVKRNLLQRLEDLSYHDQMSKLGNKHALVRYLEEIDRTKSIGILYSDVCGLKRVNDTLGHAAGDQLLLQACACLRKAFAGYEIFRIGGDEMLVVASGLKEEDFYACCNKLREVAVEEDVPLAIGYLWRACVDKDTDSLIDEADMLMYEDKRAFYSADLEYDFASEKSMLQSYDTLGDRSKKIVMDEYVRSHFEQALENRYIQVYYQPVYSAATQKICAFESLARWNAPVKGMLSPAAFIPPLEDSRQIYKLDLYVVEEACRLLHENIKSGKATVPITVNLSRWDFLCCDIVAEIEKLAATYDVPRKLLCIEVTESIMLHNPERVHVALEKFRELGYPIWMDDFGSGYSSLSVLKDYTFDLLKMDMSFLTTSSKKAQTIMENIFYMAKAIGVGTLTEGVETKEQFEFLRCAGCEYMQGYYFGKPMPYVESLKHCEENGYSLL